MVDPAGKSRAEIALEATREADINIVEWLDCHPEHLTSFLPVLAMLRQAMETLVIEIDETTKP